MTADPPRIPPGLLRQIREAHEVLAAHIRDAQRVSGDGSMLATQIREAHRTLGQTVLGYSGVAVDLDPVGPVALVVDDVPVARQDVDRAAHGLDRRGRSSAA
jgi:hypothetical protein